MNVTIGVLLALAILIILFFIFREFNNWYWKINERISIAHKISFLLEKISMQLGATDLDEITIEEIATGKTKKVKLDSWIEFKIKNPKATGYKTVNNGMTTERK